MLGKRHKDGHVERDENGDVVRHMGNREWLLEEALKEKERAERFEPLPRPLAEALERELRSLFQQALFEKMEDEWLDWGFEFPEYSDELVTTDEVGDYVPWFELAAAAQAQGHAHRAQLVRRKRDRFKTRAWLPKTKYFTVSEVAENRSDSRTLTNWGLLPDEEGGYDVFDVTSILQNDPSIDVEGFFEKTKVGRQIVSERVVEALKAKSQKPLGKVLTWRRPEEISEHDGQDGRNLWCVIGNIVYDITNFRFHSEAERKALTAVATGQKTAAEGLHAFDIPALLRRLAVYKCGYLKQAAGLEPGERTFTLRELGRYIYPEVGMYCAVNNVILDLGRYLESHPGGSEILRQYAGRDASVEFENAHSDSQRLLLEYENLRVGWIVYDLFDHNHIKPDELMLFDRAYNITMIARDDTEDFYHALLRHAGTDATEALKDEAPPYALRQLLTRDDMVTAKRPPAMRDITAAELRNHGYIPSRAERREKPGPRDQSWRVWVSAVAGELGNASAPLKKMVFDVTAMVMFGGPELEQKLRPWLGKEVGDDGVADMLCSRQYESFIIGRLVESESSVPEKALAKPKGRVQSQAVAGSKRQADSLSEGSPGSTGQSKRRSTRGRERA
ncbi:hypothetical protein N658DRAFT_459306 [Parathielavia hyrcaniae]|uniref:Cytochrome b5 heme-binding domain-containing protein n=1 Tax=Parathielavia hyrcaniae TaxID=113614 RepID=A0AAN6SX58_9PEZI|nr:hypothetical protein N658DRAFT_459306 [Parathielavia hyrcaniae]